MPRAERVIADHVTVSSTAMALANGPPTFRRTSRDSGDDALSTSVKDQNSQLPTPCGVMPPMIAERNSLPPGRGIALAPNPQEPGEIAWAKRMLGLSKDAFSPPSASPPSSILPSCTEPRG